MAEKSLGVLHRACVTQEISRETAAWERKHSVQHVDESHRAQRVAPHTWNENWMATVTGDVDKDAQIAASYHGALIMLIASSITFNYTGATHTILRLRRTVPTEIRDRV